MLRIERVGITTVQDIGRRGLAHLGVPTSGAADRASYLLANRLAGNAPSAAMFETSGGLSFTALDDVDVVVTGAECDAAIGSRPAAQCAPMLLRAGETFNVTRIREGVRAYVAVSGGIVGTPILGSLSHDTLSGIVPVALHTGASLRVGVAVSAPSSLDAPVRPDRLQSLRVSPGPHRELVGSAAVDGILRGTFRVSESSDRIGVRMRGASDPITHGAGVSLARDIFSLPSVPLVRGAVQLTPSGDLIVMLADHPATGGYPVIAVAHPNDVDRLTQTAANQVLRISWREPGAD
jgi:biotin-dependent carboxylase-like uncharacterized protein